MHSWTDCEGQLPFSWQGQLRRHLDFDEADDDEIADGRWLLSMN